MNSRTILVLLSTSLSATLYAADVPAPPTDAVLKKFSGVDAVVDDAVRAASVTRDRDPIKFICRDMKSVVGELDEFHTDKPVQVKEQEVVSQLDDGDRGTGKGMQKRKARLGAESRQAHARFASSAAGPAGFTN